MTTRCFPPLPDLVCECIIQKSLLSKTPLFPLIAHKISHWNFYWNYFNLQFGQIGIIRVNPHKMFRAMPGTEQTVRRDQLLWMFFSPLQIYSSSSPSCSVHQETDVCGIHHPGSLASAFLLDLVSRRSGRRQKTGRKEKLGYISQLFTLQCCVCLPKATTSARLFFLSESPGCRVSQLGGNSFLLFLAPRELHHAQTLVNCFSVPPLSVPSVSCWEPG